MGIQARKALVADEKAVLNASTGDIDVAVADTYVETAWKEGKMVFRREKLDKITEKLSRKFGVTIRLEGDKLKEYEYTATFTDETLDDILDLLTRSAPITYRITKQKQREDKTFTQREIIIQTM
jgi:ferric-dicitrate binding protein FerR (iron transport regulator)